MSEKNDFGLNYTAKRLIHLSHSYEFHEMAKNGFEALMLLI